MSGLMLLGALALWVVGGFMAIAGGTDIHLGFGLLIIGAGVIALGIGGVCDGLADVKRELRKQAEKPLSPAAEPPR